MSKEVVERDIETVERAINSIIEKIAWYKEMASEPTDLESIGAIQGQLAILKDIESLEEVLRMFNINSYEQENVVFKVKTDK